MDNPANEKIGGATCKMSCANFCILLAPQIGAVKTGQRPEIAAI
jgi:hypothetical protein